MLGDVTFVWPSPEKNRICHGRAWINTQTILVYKQALRSSGRHGTLGGGALRDDH